MVLVLYTAMVVWVLVMVLVLAWVMVWVSLLVPDSQHTVLLLVTVSVSERLELRLTRSWWDQLTVITYRPVPWVWSTVYLSVTRFPPGTVERFL